MPMAKIYLRKGSSAEHKRAISEAIHVSLVDVLGIPNDDKFHFFHEFDADNMITVDEAFGLPRRPDKMVCLQLYFGPRPQETIAALFQAVVSNITRRTSLTREDVLINVIESPSPHWWVAGRELDPKTGFDVRIAADKIPKS